MEGIIYRFERGYCLDSSILKISFIISSTDGSVKIGGCPGVDSRHPSLTHRVWCSVSIFSRCRMMSRPLFKLPPDRWWCEPVNDRVIAISGWCCVLTSRPLSMLPPDGWWCEPASCDRIVVSSGCVADDRRWSISLPWYSEGTHNRLIVGETTRQLICDHIFHASCVEPKVMGFHSYRRGYLGISNDHHQCFSSSASFFTTLNSIKLKKHNNWKWIRIALSKINSLPLSEIR